ncbi:MAG: hypothetical protein WC666_03925, partial [Candidatus Paceibacterota bacterium]
MAEVIIETKAFPEYSSDYKGKQDIDSLRSLRFADGKLRIENGAFIITDETGVDRVLIGFYKDL